MSKRRKIQVSEENQEESLSKPKKNSRKKIHLTRESDLESLTQSSQTRQSLSIPEVYEERKEHLEEGQELSSAKLPKDYSECKELDDTKVAMPSSQNRKIVPTFTKSKKSLIKRPEKCFKETATANCTKEDQHVDENVSRTENTIQNPVTSAESSVTKMENARDQIIPHCDGINERLDIKIQDKCGIREINTIDAALGLSASQPEAGIERSSQASSREEEMSQKQVPFSLRASSNNDVNNSEKEALSLEPLTCQPAKQMNVSQLPGDESIDRIKSGRNEEGSPDSSGPNVQQDKPRQMILETDETDEPETSGIMNGNGKDSRDSECMASLTQKVADGIQLPVIEDVVIPTPGKWNPYSCTTLYNSVQFSMYNSEKEALSLEPLTGQPAKQMNVSQLPGEESIDRIKSGRNEEGGPDSSGPNVQQDKPRQMILEADETDEPETNGIMNGNGKDSRDSEGMASLRQKVADGMQLPVIEDVVIPTPGKWNPSPCTTLYNSVQFSMYNSEKEALSLEPLTCQPAKQMNVSQLPGDESIDRIKSGRNEEGGPDSSGPNVQQDKPREMILETDETDEPETSGIRNGNGKDSCDSEGIASLTQKVADRIQLPVIEDVVIPTPGKWNPSPCTTPCADRQRNADVGETEGLPDKSGETEEQNDNCACSNSEISPPGASKSIPIKKASDRRNLETNGQLVEKGIRRIDSGRKDSTPAEQNSIKNQTFSHVQAVDPCLEKEVDHSQPIWDQLILKDGLISPQLNGDVLPERRDIFVEDRTVWVKERMDNSAEANVPALLTQKENAICSEPLVLNSQQSENNLMVDNVMSAVPSGNVEKTVQVSKVEPKSGENVFFAVDLHTADEEPAQGEGYGCRLSQGESNLPSVESLPPRVLGDPNKEVHAQSKMQGSSAAYGPDPGLAAPKDLDAVAQAYSPCPDSFSLDLESLPDGPWEGLLESQAVEFQSQKTHALKDLQTCCKDTSNQHATRKLKGENKIPPPDSTGAHANNVRDEMKTICDPSKQEDATEVVYGLIKELSNLNRLTMSTHRDLDSFKRLQSRRSKYGRLPSHGLNHMTSMAGSVKKKREL